MSATTQNTSTASPSASNVHQLEGAPPTTPEPDYRGAQLRANTQKLGDALFKDGDIVAPLIFEYVEFLSAQSNVIGLTFNEHNFESNLALLAKAGLHLGPAAQATIRERIEIAGKATIA